MTVSLPLPALAGWLRAELAGGPAGSVAVLAGHFAIFTSGGHATDLLDDTPVPAGAPAGLLEFTRVTWEAACDAIASEPAAGARLLVLADDVQFVRPALADRPAAERLGAALAADYLTRNGQLPAYHSRTLRSRGLGDETILRQSDRRWLFSERELRSGLVASLKTQLGSGDPRSAGLTANTDRSMITFADPEHGEYCVVHSGHTNCAGGFVELLSEVRRRGIRKLISLVPMRCLGPITVGTALATRLFGLDDLKVVSVAVPELSTGLPASVVGV